MEKRGQFYLMAAIIIIIIILGFIAIKSYIKTEDTKTAVYDLEKEFGLESGKVVDYTIYSGADFDTIMYNWTQIYMKEKNQNVDEFVVVYGNSTSQSMMNLTKTNTGVVAIGGTSLAIGSATIGRTNIQGNNISVMLGGITYNFNLGSGKNFVFLIRERGYVARYGEEDDD